MTNKDAPMARTTDEGSEIITRSVKLGYGDAASVAGTVSALQLAQQRTTPTGTLTSGGSGNLT